MNQDEETGELITSEPPVIYLSPVTIPDSETGEIETSQGSKFRIPSSYLNRRYSNSNNRNFKGMKKLSPSDPDTTDTAAILYLLSVTVLFYFFPVLSLLFLFLEVRLHVWMHKKNKQLSSYTNKYYRSPLHGLCKEFCAICVEEESRMRITKIQDKRNDKLKKYGLEYVRRIVA